MVRQSTAILVLRENYQNSNIIGLELKDVCANCFCASLLRMQIHMPRHTSSARAKY